MAATDLKANFQNQLKEIDEKIEQIQGELVKAKEYKLKLIGGLETLELLETEMINEQKKVSDDLTVAFNPDFPDTSEIPAPDNSPCEVSEYTPGVGESPIQ